MLISHKNMPFPKQETLFSVTVLHTVLQYAKVNGKSRYVSAGFSGLSCDIYRGPFTQKQMGPRLNFLLFQDLKSHLVMSSKWLFTLVKIQVKRS